MAHSNTVIKITQAANGSQNADMGNLAPDQGQSSYLASNTFPQILTEY